jgi:hypothetical protein
MLELFFLFSALVAFEAGYGADFVNVFLLTTGVIFDQFMSISV